jgi:hypothetical protein
MRPHALKAIFVCAMATAIGCSATRSVRPVGRGNVNVAASIGGPLFRNLGPPLPVPLPVVSARVGLTDCTDVDFGVMLPVSRTAGLDLGASTLILQGHHGDLALMAGGRLTALSPVLSPLRPTFITEGSLTASWALTPSLLPYLGADLLLELRTGRVHPTTLAGLTYASPLAGFSLAAEVRWLAIATDARRLSVRYVSPWSHGALAAVVAISYTFHVPDAP